jgi:hypothetical protein
MDAFALTSSLPQFYHPTEIVIRSSLVTAPLDEEQRLIQNRRNARRTAAVLWLIVASIFFYVLGRYYWLSQ